MNRTIENSKLPSNLAILTKEEQTNIKGGLLIYCEEKRRTNIFGKPYKATVWKMKPNGSLFITVRA